MRFNELTESNYMLFAIKFYNNPQALTKDDFDEDLKRIRYIKKLLRKYRKDGILKSHLLLNHLTVLFNVFDDAAVPLLFYNMEEDLWPSLKSFLIFLKRIPEYPKTELNNIPDDDYCTRTLNSI
jgi:hypothetical protein|tara:strand:+ start:125 stop:496 length:372 start_codon:yes stop_codon:yes gene_type:complete